MTYKRALESPIKSTYLILLIAGYRSYNEMKDILRLNFNRDDRKSNLSKAFRELEKEGYIKEKNINRRKIKNDIFKELDSVTDKFKHTFYMENKKITRKKAFRYNKRCRYLDYDLLYEEFSDLCRKSIGSGIMRSYYDLIRDFLTGYAMPDDFFEDYNSYITTRRTKKLDKGIKEICREYSTIRSLGESSILVRYQD